MFELHVDDEITLRSLEPPHADALFALIDANRRHLRRWLPWLDTNNTVTGHNRIDWENRISWPGYWLAEGLQGNGIMTRSCRALINHAFTELKLNRIDIHCAVDNKKSQAIPQRLGFQQAGTVHQAEWLYDKYVDHIIYRMLKSREYNMLDGLPQK